MTEESGLGQPGHTRLPNASLIRMPPRGSPWGDRLKWWSSVVVAGFFALRVLAVNVFPIITNDSLAYLSHSASLIDTGFVQLGYRQVGYPLLLALTDTVSSTVGLEPLLVTALAQRLLLLTGLVYAAWLWRWRAVPFIFIATTPSLLVYTNFVLTEGPGVGLAVVYGCLVAHTLRLILRHQDEPENGKLLHRLLIAASASGVAYALLMTVRFHYIVLAPGVLVVLWAMFRATRPTKRPAVIILSALLTFVGVFIAGLTVENAEEYGVLYPSARGERVQYWATWHVVFTLKPDNRNVEAIEDLYAGGTPYAFMNEVESSLQYAEQKSAYKEAIRRLTEETETSLSRERIRAFLGTLIGGRLDDIPRLVEDAVAADHTNVEESIYSNSYVAREGIQEFLRRYNSGRTIEPLITSPISPMPAGPYLVTLFRGTLPLALAILLGGLFVTSARHLALIGATAWLVTAALLGFFLLDNVRFLLTQSMFAMTTATGTFDEIWSWLRVQGQPSRAASPQRGAMAERGEAVDNGAPDP